MKIVTILGARPQFIKASALSNLIKKQKKIKEIIIHTGQHYDYQMSNIFFKELKVPKPNYNLNIKSKFHGEMTGKMISGIEKILLKEEPNYTIVYGDTNSTLAGALAAQKLQIPIIHIEAGLRSYNKNMPEELNRVLTDHCSSILFVPSKIAEQNLKHEGIKKNIFNVGDVMYDLFKSVFSKLKKNKNVYEILVTIHRAENTNCKMKMVNIIKNLNELSNKYSILFPLHPRTKNLLKEYKILKFLDSRIKVVNPISYINTMYYLKYAKFLVTDTGGMQKEAFFSKTQTLTVRDETEWKETIDLGWNRLVKPIENQIFFKTEKFLNFYGKKRNVYGNGNAAKLILNTIRTLK